MCPKCFGAHVELGVAMAASFQLPDAAPPRNQCHGPTPTAAAATFKIMDNPARISLSLFAIGVTALVTACSGGTDAEDPAPTTTSTTTSASTTTTSATASGGPTAPEATVATDRYPDATGACTLFAPSQVTLIVGEGAPEADGDECEIEGPDDHSVDVRTATLSGNAYYGDLDGFKSNLEERGMEAIPGIGDAAYWDPDESSTTEAEMYVATGNAYAQISIDLYRPGLDDLPTTDERKALIIPLAMTAADRLPATP